MTRIILMGTPAFAVPTLNALAEAGRYDIVGVVTQPDRPAGRGHKLTACPVKQRALELGLNVLQFERLRRPEGVAAIRELAPDVVVTAAFGQILSQELLDIPKYGTLNVHASLLPKHRGAAPIQWSILMGDRTTGVTIMRTDAGLDTGDMLRSAEVEIGEDETAGELTERLSQLGARLLVETLDDWLAGRIAPVKQDESESSYEPMLTRELSEIDWTKPAEQIARQVRGLNPWPEAVTSYNGGKLKVCRARTAAFETDAEPGTVVASGAREGLIVACGEGCLELTEIQAPGSKRMSAKAYLMGRSIAPGTRLGEGETHEER